MLDKILTFLRTGIRSSGRGNNIDNRELLSILNTEAGDLASNPPSDADFTVFLKKIHDMYILADTTIRGAFLRVIRLSMNSAVHCVSLVREEIHWIVITSLEREVEQVTLERMQALKLVKKYMAVSSDTFPISFARSLVAIANHRDDNIRRVCIETLRELSVVNPDVVATVNGFACLLEAVLDPSTHDMGESIVMSLLYLMNSGSTRRCVRPFLDLRTLLSPFSDLDTEIGELTLRWKSAKVAFVTIMRTWVGLIILTADPLGLGTLISMIKDKKVSTALQDVILDAFSDLLEPLISKRKRSQITTDYSELSEDDGNCSFRGMPNSSRDRDQSFSSADKGQAGADSRKSYITALWNLRTQSPFSPGGHNRRKNSGVSISKDRSISDFASSNLMSLQGDKKDSYDPLFNIMDSYAAILCCALIYRGMIDSLIVLGTQNESDLGRKARTLLIDLLRIICRVFPESFSTENLTMPTLLEFATSSMNSAGDSHRASQILFSVAEAFSLSQHSYTPQGNGQEAALAISAIPHTFSTSFYQTNLQVPKSSMLLRTSHATDKGELVKSGGTTALSPSASKLLPTNTVRSLSDLSLELKNIHNCQSIVSVNSASYNLLQDLNAKLINPADKAEFKKQIDASKVTGREGKEPLKWDWASVQDVLKGSYTSSDRLAEILETKWVRRVAGFFRCSTEEKAYFANMEWEPANMFYLQCVFDLYIMLANDPKGVAFIETYRSATLFQDISREIELLTQQYGQGWLNSTPRLVFRFTNCNQSMCREYFHLIGRMLVTEQCRYLIENSGLQEVIAAAGSKKPLEYLGRVSLSALIFSDRGIMSRQLLYNWLNNKKLSSELRTYCHTLLLALLRSKPQEFSKWGVEIVLSQLFQENSSKYLEEIIGEAVQDSRLLSAILALKGYHSHILDVPQIQLRVVACENGIELLHSKNTLQKLIQNWTQNDNSNYALQVEASLAKALNRSYMKRLTSDVEKIPIQTIETSPMIGDLSYIGSDDVGARFNLGGDNVDIEGLLKVPWIIEVKLTSASPAAQSTYEYLRIDTFLDASELPFPASSEVSCDNLRTVKVRGIILDGKGIPVGHPIGTNRMISNCLLAGTCGVNRNGELTLSSSHPDGARKKSAAAPLQPQQALSRQPSSVAISQVDNDDSEHVTFSKEQYYDWSHCKPHHRQSNSVTLPDGRIAVTVPEHPVTWIFSKAATGSNPTSEPPEFEMTGSAANTIIYLVEVQYHIKLETNMPLFVPAPRHLYGELSRTRKGCVILTELRIIEEQITIVKDESVVENNRKAAFWALGHICSTDLGCSAVCDFDGQFIDCRSKRGSTRLYQLNWLSAPLGSNTGVAIPQNISSLFELQNLALDWVESTVATKHKPYIISSLSAAEMEVLDLIMKMPGVILYADSKSKLEAIRSQRPEVFSNRQLYLATRYLLDNYTFKLSARRDIFSMFPTEAKCRGVK